MLRPGRFGLLVHAPFYADEIRALDEFRTETEWVAPQELGTGHRQIEFLAGPFEPAKYQDTYRQPSAVLTTICCRSTCRLRPRLPPQRELGWSWILPVTKGARMRQPFGGESGKGVVGHQNRA